MEKEELRKLIKETDDQRVLDALWELYEVKYMIKEQRVNVSHSKSLENPVLTTNLPYVFDPKNLQTYLSTSPSYLETNSKINSVEPGFNPVTGE